ncbi:hypothetical protein [Paenibacillus sp. IITD108]|uniref:hypothetical protein n=1 Tax=Paenibacillus sp. IITD108 TaxID=3116649 RepID=UPI002F40FE7D
MRILPVSEPIVSVYPKHSIPLSVLCNHEQTLDWLLSQYIQIKVHKNYITSLPTDWCDFYTIDPRFSTSPWLHSECVTRSSIMSWSENDPISFFIKCIDLGMYISTRVDEFYINNTKANLNKYYFPHAILVYGYDENNQLFYISGYDINGKFSKIKVSFANFEQAFLSLNNSELEFFSEFTHLMTFRENIFNYKLDFNWIYKQMYDYLNCENTSLRFGGLINTKLEDFYYGLQVYDKVMDYYEINNNTIDHRPLHLIWEHKKLMIVRLKHMENKQKELKLSDEIMGYYELEQIAQITRNLMLKINVTKNLVEIKKINNNLEDMKKIKNNLEEMKKKERNILHLILLKLQPFINESRD